MALGEGEQADLHGQDADLPAATAADKRETEHGNRLIIFALQPSLCASNTLMFVLLISDLELLGRTVAGNRYVFRRRGAFISVYMCVCCPLMFVK